jgi:hypothetical protein
MEATGLRLQVAALLEKLALLNFISTRSFEHDALQCVITTNKSEILDSGSCQSLYTPKSLLLMRQPARCVAPNAFRFQYAVWKLFLEPLLPVQPSRGFVSASSRRATDADTPAPDKAHTLNEQPDNVVKEYHWTTARPGVHRADSYPIVYNPPGENLTEALRQVRIKNRESLVRRVVLEPSTSAHTKRPDHPDLRPRIRKKLLLKNGSIENSAALADHASGFAHHIPVSQSPAILQRSKKRKSKISSDDPHVPDQLESTASKSRDKSNLAKLEVAEYTGRYVYPTKSNTTPAKDFPWMKGQEETWGVER